MQWTTNNWPEVVLGSADAAINNFFNNKQLEEALTSQVRYATLLKYFSEINSSLIIKPDEGDNKLVERQ
jgi:hypothetical protein